jgi:DNA-binding transcriptional LysR family regulator
MQLRDIQYVIAAAESGSFSKAAEAIYVTQPTLSQAIQRLEEELGEKLFVREKNPISLTYAGKLFLEDGYKVDQIINTIPKKMSDIQNLRRGRLDIGISQFYGKYYFAKIIPQFQKKYPGIELHITEEISAVLEDKILNGKLDFCIFSLPILSERIIYETIFEEEIMFAVPRDHPLNTSVTAQEGDDIQAIDLALFAKDDFIMIKPGQRMHIIGMDLCKQAGFTPHIIFETRNTETANVFIANGMGVGFIPASVRAVTPVKDRPVYFHLKSLPTTRCFVVAYSNNNYLSEAAKAFIAFAKKNETRSSS